MNSPTCCPSSTSILDDYFFIHREVLAWKFLAQPANRTKGMCSAQLKQRAQFGTMNPHQHSSAPLSAEFLGREKVTLKNGPQELIKLELKYEAGTWQLWLDDQFKVMRMLVVGREYRSGARIDRGVRCPVQALLGRVSGEQTSAG